MKYHIEFDVDIRELPPQERNRPPFKDMAGIPQYEYTIDDHVCPPIKQRGWTGFGEMNVLEWCIRMYGEAITK